MNPRSLIPAALLALLIALALPVFSVQRERARRARCLGNLRGIWEAMMIYASDYRGNLPAVSPLLGGSRQSGENGFDRHATLLLNGGYTRDPGLFVCPSDKTDGDPFQPLSNDGSTGHARVRVAAGGPPWIPGGRPKTNFTWFNVSYVYVAGLTLRDRGEFPVLADEHWDSEGDCPAECNHDLDPFDNHGNAGRNVMFLDGNGRWLPGPKLDEVYRLIQKEEANFRTRTVD